MKVEELALFILGTNNSLLFVSILISAYAMMERYHTNIGVILLLEIAPGFILQLIYPYTCLFVPMKYKVGLLYLFSFCGIFFLFFAFHTIIELVYIAIPFLSMGSYFGESVIVSYTSNFPVSHFSYWSSGTGFTGILVSASYILFEKLLGNKVFLFYFIVYLVNLTLGLTFLKYGESFTNYFGRKNENPLSLQVSAARNENNPDLLTVPINKRKIHSYPDDMTNWNQVITEPVLEPDSELLIITDATAPLYSDHTPETNVNDCTLGPNLDITEDNTIYLDPDGINHRPPISNGFRRVLSVPDGELTKIETVKKLFLLIMVSSPLLLGSFIRYFFSFALIPYIVINPLHYEMVTFVGYSAVFLGRTLGNLYLVKSIYYYNLIHFYNLIAGLILLLVSLKVQQIMVLMFFSNLLNASCYPQVYKFVLGSDQFKNSKFYVALVCQFTTLATIIAAISSIVFNHYFPKLVVQSNVTPSLLQLILTLTPTLTPTLT